MTCDLCQDPTCEVRPGSGASAYHWLSLLREAYAMNGTPRSDHVLMGIASLAEMVDTFGVRIIGPVRTPHGFPVTSLGLQAEAWETDRDNRDADEFQCIYPNEDPLREERRALLGELRDLSGSWVDAHAVRFTP